MTPSEMPGEATVQFSVATGALAKFGAEAVALLASFGTGIVTARNLGPAGKGTLATLGYVLVLVAATSGLGLGEAGATAIARGRTPSTVSGPTLALLGLSSGAGMGLFVIASYVQWFDRWHELTRPIALSAVAIPFAAAMVVVAALVDARGAFGVTSLARVLASVVTLIATVVVVLGARGGLEGAVLAATIGWFSGAAVLAVALVRLGGTVRPRWDSGYLRPALRHGVPVQFSQLLMMATTRADLLVVQVVAGTTPAGLYSVALTLGSLNTFPALAVAAAAYPRIAGLPADEVGDYVARVVSGVVLAAIALGVGIAIALPAAPLAFGAGFRGAVGPAVLLLVGGVLWSAQWVLCRAAAARREGRVLVRSFGTSLVVMLVLDFSLVPRFGIGGAAVGALVCSAAGLAVAATHAHRQWGVVPTALLPRRADLQGAVSALAAIVRRGRGSGGGDAAGPPPAGDVPRGRVGS